MVFNICQTEFERQATFSDEAIRIMRGAIAKYGERHQMLKAVEEMSELTHEITRFVLDGGEINGFYEELVDSIIMLDQLVIILLENGRDCNDRMSELYARKLSRLRENLMNIE